jgi:hypothetical protein
MSTFPAMSPLPLKAGQPGPDADLKGYSCLTCRQRKIKCDRHRPCSNCVKAAQQCSFIAPVSGKRKRTKAPKEGLHARLRRYEKLLTSYGEKIEPSEYGDGSDSETVGTVSQPDGDMAEENAAKQPLGASPGYFDKEGLSNLEGEVSLGFSLLLLRISLLIFNSFFIRETIALLGPQMTRTFTILCLTSFLALLSLRQTITPQQKISWAYTFPITSCRSYGMCMLIELIL